MPAITVSRPPLARSSTAMSSAIRSGSWSGTSSAEIDTASVLRAAEDESGHHERRGTPPVLGAVVLLEREHVEPVLVGVPRHVDERAVPGRHLDRIEAGLHAVEPDDAERHEASIGTRGTPGDPTWVGRGGLGGAVRLSCDREGSWLTTNCSRVSDFPAASPS